jgi:hypothetical protein
MRTGDGLMEGDLEERRSQGPAVESIRRMYPELDRWACR